MATDYRQLGIETYGARCEICHFGIVEVHHINYQEHQEMENRLRAAVKKGKDISQLLLEAYKQGFREWDGHQLSKDNRSTALSVLCPNCHTLIHRMDIGMKLLGALTPRK
jgi:hypothetical protein